MSRYFAEEHWTDDLIDGWYVRQLLRTGEIMPAMVFGRLARERGMQGSSEKICRCSAKSLGRFSS